ncbi:hypothetical protein CEV33_0731 [Brucella grignonensis]|uniref:Uncharacterized protein n=1 Tax=Brucella grignonensis TaxID=94627 RepID=A0A256FGE5_9HYPH|nr:hypothetical protein CEV33_0731 [Brucella grignonensis]
MHVVYFERVPKNVEQFSDQDTRENKMLRRADLIQSDRNRLK